MNFGNIIGGKGRGNDCCCTIIWLLFLLSICGNGFGENCDCLILILILLLCNGSMGYGDMGCRG